MSPTAVCLDTNILISLSLIYYNNRSSIKKMKDRNYTHYKSLKTLLSLIENNKIKIYVLPLVLVEAEAVSKRCNFKTMQFIAKHKESITPMSISNKKIKKLKNLLSYVKVDELAKIYCSSNALINKNGNVVKIKQIFSNKRNEPSHDAIIMAQATLLGHDIITHDSDFLGKGRPYRILDVNRLFTSTEVRPYSCREYLAKMGYIENSIQSEDEEQLIEKTYQEVLAFG
ncbi:MAG: hypothetical protein PHI76_01480 [Clostridia bacterium]|nr:hypothetical protein [Clostridia bacterium]